MDVVSGDWNVKRLGMRQRRRRVRRRSEIKIMPRRYFMYHFGCVIPALRRHERLLSFCYFIAAKYGFCWAFGLFFAYRNGTSVAGNRSSCSPIKVVDVRQCDGTSVWIIHKINIASFVLTMEKCLRSHNKEENG